MGLEIRIAKRIDEAVERKGRFWSDRYRHDLRTPSETRNALRYSVTARFADPFSSATTFDGFARAPTRFENAVDWTAVEPRTWLLDVGWALIDPADAPADERAPANERVALLAGARSIDTRQLRA